MKILVTGSAGVIGQTLVPYLRSKGHEVTEFDIRRDLTQDVTDESAVFSAFDSLHDVCIHLAAQVGRITGEEHPSMSIRSNMLGTLNIAKACMEYGTFLINFSTSEVLGHNSEFRDGEPDILSQNGMYGLTKLAAEGIIKHNVDTYGLKAISIRPYMIYGPYEAPNGVYRSAVSNFISAAYHGVPYVAHIGCIRAWCYVSDFVEGIGIVIENLDRFNGYEAFPIGTEEYRTMLDCAAIVKRVVGRGEYTMKEPPEFLVSAVKRADFSYIQRLGFKPKVMLEEGVERTFRWMLDTGILDKDKRI